MRIFFPIGAFYPSQIGGPCNSIYWHTSELKKHNIDIDIVTTTIGIKENEVKSDEFIQDKCGNVYYGKGGCKNIKTLLTAINKVKTTDIIHLNSLFNFISIVVFFYSKLYYKKKVIIWSVRGELNERALKYSFWKKRIIMYLYKKSYKNIIFHSTSEQETKDICISFKHSKIIQLPNLITPTKRYVKSDVKKDLLYVGRIHPIEAIHKIIEGLSLSEIFIKSDFKLLIVGKHENRHNDYIRSLEILIKEKKLEDKVEFRGHLIGKEKEIIFAKSYATLLLSETENFGNVVLESLNQGTPVIASSGTPWSILESYKCGYHISNDPTSISNAINKIMTLDIKEYNKICNNSIRLLDDEFNVQYQISRWIDQYNLALIKSKSNK